MLWVRPDGSVSRAVGAPGFTQYLRRALVQLTTDKSRTGAHRFYERLGFVASHEGMKLSLDRA